MDHHQQQSEQNNNKDGQQPNEGIAAVDRRFLCQLTGRAMVDPVSIKQCGHSFERHSIDKWIKAHHHFHDDDDAQVVSLRKQLYCCPVGNCFEFFHPVQDIKSNVPLYWEILYFQRQRQQRQGQQGESDLLLQDNDIGEKATELMKDFDIVLHDTAADSFCSLSLKPSPMSTKVESGQSPVSPPPMLYSSTDTPPSMPRRKGWKNEPNVQATSMNVSSQRIDEVLTPPFLRRSSLSTSMSTSMIRWKGKALRNMSKTSKTNNDRIWERSDGDGISRSRGSGNDDNNSLLLNSPPQQKK